VAILDEKQSGPDDKWSELPVLARSTQLTFVNASSAAVSCCSYFPTQRLIPKLGDLDSYYPTLCADDHIENVSKIRHLNGRHQPAATPQVSRE
jgi:hypothetical protein